MKHLRTSLVILLSLIINSGISAVSMAAPAIGQNQSTALERGYRTGYSDGYNAGYKDIGDHSARDHRSKEEYQRADRTYNEVWGPLEDYRDGYQQGFEAGYSAGYERQAFNSSIPTGLRRRENAEPIANTQTSNNPVDNNAPNANPIDNNTSYPTTSSTTVSNAPMSGPTVIPGNTTMLIELDSSLSTDATQPGDRFEAHVVQPGEYQGAIIDGRVTRVNRAGKVKGVAELQLAFERIRMSDGRQAAFSAQVVEVIDMGGSESGQVDPEGGIKGKDSTKDDVSRVGAATGIGAIIGAIFGGGKGAAIGAGVGGAAGTGSVLTKRGKDIRLDRGQQLRIRSATETRIQ